MKLCHVLPVVYAGCLALSLFGCGGNENGSGGDGASSTQVTSGEAVERAAGEFTANDQGNVGKAIMMATSEHFREMQDFLLRLLKRVEI